MDRTRGFNHFMLPEFLMHGPSPSASRHRRIACAAILGAVLGLAIPFPAQIAAASPLLTSAEGTWLPVIANDRMRHGAVRDPARDRMLVFGGESGGRLSNEVRALALSGTSDWVTITATGTPPVARRSAGVVYDPVRDRLLVFGGSDGFSLYNDLWALSLTGTPHWSFLGYAAPLLAPREEHVTVYDSAHDRLIVFGGSDEAHHVRSDCWALPLSGAATWSALAAGGSAPLPRQSAAGIYDPVRDRLLIFGGSDSTGTPLSDTWSLPLSSGGAWAPLPLSTGEPGLRTRAAAAYDASRDEMIVYGGRSASALLDGVLTLSLAGTAAWNLPSSSTARPTAREWTSAVVDPVRDRLVIVGGGTPLGATDVDAYSLAGTHPWTTITPTPAPKNFRAAAMVRDPVRGRMLVFGGLDGASVANNEVWSFNLTGPAVWTKLTPLGTPPLARAYASIVYDAARDRMLLYGGANFSPFGVFGDVWALQLSGTPTWQLVATAGTAPVARYLHSAILDPVRDRLVVFGGFSGGAPSNELWTLDLAGTPTWTQRITGDPALPAPRWAHGAFYDAVRDRMVISGGTDLTIAFLDTWALPLAGALHWQALPVAGPAPTARYLSAWAYDSGRDRLIEYGGRDLPGTRFADAWAIQFGATNQWIALQPAGVAPPARADGCGAFDPAHDRFVFTGGRTATSFLEGVSSIDWIATLADVPPFAGPGAALSPPFPNPTRDAADVRLVVPEHGRVELVIHDVTGRRVRALADELREPGNWLVHWDGRDDRGTRVPAGVYFVQMRSANRVLHQRIVRLE